MKIIIEYKKNHPEAQELVLEGWKGIGHIDILKDFNNDFVVKEWIKSKENGMAKERKTKVSKEDVNRMLGIIREFKPEVEYKCYFIARKLGWDWKEFWKYRKTYFKTYYFPLKVLEAK